LVLVSVSVCSNFWFRLWLRQTEISVLSVWFKFTFRSITNWEHHEGPSKFLEAFNSLFLEIIWRKIKTLWYFWEHLIKVWGALLVPGALVGKHWARVYAFTNYKFSDYAISNFDIKAIKPQFRRSGLKKYLFEERVFGLWNLTFKVFRPLSP
jgi:hypothetical protein